MSYASAGVARPLDLFRHDSLEDKQWIVPSLFVCLFCCGCVLARFVSFDVSVTAFKDLKRLVPTGGAQIWWTIFQTSMHETPSDGVDTSSRMRRCMSSIGRFCLRSQTRRNPSIITFFVALSNEKGSNEITQEEFGELMRERVMARHERFRSRVSRSDDRFFEVMDGQEMMHYVSELPHPQVQYKDLANRINNYLTSKIDVYERLWEAEISTGPMGASGAIRQDLAKDIGKICDRETVALFRIHHALCDGVSLSVAVGDLCDEGEELNAKIAAEVQKRRAQAKRMSLFERINHVFKRIMFYTVGTVVALALQFWRSIVGVNPFDQVIKASKSDDCGRSTLWRHTASIREMKEVAKCISKSATINDVFVACVTSAINKQLLEHKRVLESSGTNLQIPKHFNVVIPVHLSGGILLKGQSLGNKIGAFVTAVPVRGDLAPGVWLKKVSRSLMEGKMTPAAIIAWMLAKFLSDFAPLKVAKWALRNGNAKSVAVISNVKGFPFHTHWNGRRLEFLAAFLPLPPGIPIGIVVQSYAGDMSFSVEAEKRVVPDATKFADWVIEEYENLKADAFCDKAIVDSK